MTINNKIILIVISTIFYAYFICREYKPELVFHKSDVIKQAEKKLSLNNTQGAQIKLSKSDAKKIMFADSKTINMINADIFFTYIKDGLKFSPIFIAIAIKDYNMYVGYLPAYVAYYAITKILKHSVKKTRPDKLNTKSFPSGHAASAFLGAGYLAQALGSYYVAIPALILATAVSYSRVYANRHTAIDIIAGAIIGFLCGFYTKHIIQAIARKLI